MKSSIITNLDKNDRIAIVTHTNPDGDAIGCCFAMKKILKEYKTTIVLEKELSNEYFLSFGTVEIFHTKMRFDAIIVLDTNECSRLGKVSSLLEFNNNIIVIDHHVATKNGIKSKLEIIHSDYASTGMILHKIFKKKIALLSKSDQKYYSECIYLTILADTGGFKNPNTDFKAFEVCSDLMNFGLNPSEVYRKFFLGESPTSIQFVGEVLSKIEVFESEKIIFAYCEKPLMQKYDFQGKDLPDIIGHIQRIKNYKIAVFFKQITDTDFKISLRSFDLNVRQIALFFGGGGHILASGATLCGGLEQIKKEVLVQCKKLL